MIVFSNNNGKAIFGSVVGFCNVFIIYLRFLLLMITTIQLKFNQKKGSFGYKVQSSIY